LQDENGSLLANHHDKEFLLWQAFEERIGTSEFSGFAFDIEFFKNSVDFPQDLELDFRETEIDNVVRNLPNDKSPGPDGFNNEFLKKMLANHQN